jgi:putative FmdB family regulatory protein
MPTYGFRCPKGHEFDRFYKTISGAPAELECPECGQPAARQIHGGAGLAFKGSGFYLTDYGKNAHRGEGTKTGSSGSPDTKADKKPDTKSDTKADAKPKAESSTPAASKPATKPKAE